MKLSSFQKIVLINLGILVFYSVTIYQNNQQPDKLSYMLSMIIAIAAHASICLVLGIGCHEEKNKDCRKGFFISLGLILLIGFSTCIGGSS